MFGGGFERRWGASAFADCCAAVYIDGSFLIYTAVVPLLGGRR